ncbi:YIP1 family protein [Paenibacillus flagellatus]|nr:YIP1 family protein [Paenibacillus flagellatus]
MKRYMRKLVLGLLLASSVGAALPSAAEASLPYATYTADPTGRYVPTPHGYVPSRVIDGLRQPEHLFMTADDQLYVADTGNDRIVHMDREGRIVKTVPRTDGGREPNDNERLRRPEGVFVAEDGTLYVADTGGGRIAVFDASGRWIRDYRRPESSYVPANYLFVPSKVALDRRGYVYVANKGGYQGLLQLAPDGEFAGFYGANKVPYDPIERLKRKYYTAEQLAEEQKKLPGAITNMAVDRRGFLYTVNRGLKKGQLKRLNSGGTDLLGDADFAPPWRKGTVPFSFQAVTVGDGGIATAIESDGGRIYQYDGEGKLLFVFGGAYGNDSRFGLFKRTTGVAVDSRGDVYVSDGELGLIQVFRRTEFGSLVHRAAQWSGDGKHEEAYGVWTDILRHDGTFDRAYQGMAKAELKRGQYAEAMEHFRMAMDREGYSESFWQVRLDTATRYFAPVVLSAAGLLVAAGLGTRLLRRRRRGRAGPSGKRAQAVWTDPAAPSWRYAWRMTVRVVRHPLDGMYDIAQSSAIPIPYAVLLVALGLAVKLAGLAATGFLFADEPFRDVSLATEALSSFLLWFGWVVANYMIGSIMKGEGTFRRVFVANAYVLVPYIVCTLPLRLLSNALTLQEQGIYAALLAAVAVWTLLLFFVASLNVHNYNLKEGIGMNAVSLFALACFGLFGFVVVGLLAQAADFFIELGRELIERV